MTPSQQDKLLDARIDANLRLRVLVPRIVELQEMTFIHRGNIYLGHHPPSGQVWFFHYEGPSTGFGGKTFDLNMLDGSRETLVGPWSASIELVYQWFDDIVPKEIMICETPRAFDSDYDNRVGYLDRRTFDLAVDTAHGYGVHYVEAGTDHSRLPF